MAGAGFTIAVQGEAELERELALRQARFGDLTPLMDIIGTVLVSDAEDNFEGQHSPEGVPWKPSQRVIEHGGKTLQLSRRLRLSLTHKAGPDSVEVGTNVIYAARHQAGFSGTENVRSHRRMMSHVFGVRLNTPREVTVGAFSRKADTPARPFLGMSTGAAAEIAQHVADYAGADA